MSNIHNLIDSIVDGDTIAIQNSFEAEMADRLSSALDVYKVEVAQSVFNPVQEETEDEE